MKEEDHVAAKPWGYREKNINGTKEKNGLKDQNARNSLRKSQQSLRLAEV